VKRLLAVLLALALAACGGAGAGGDQPSEQGGATLWVTRDRGAEVLLTATVPAGLTVIQALDREAEIETRYGGRFVQAIDGIEGSLARQRDWFFFVNGIEPDVGGTEVVLEEGDVAWWDFRAWESDTEALVVVGAFPMPFTRGWEGATRPVELRAPAELADAADALRPVLGTGGSGPPNVFELAIEPGVEGAELTAERDLATDSPVTFRLAGSERAVRAAALALAADPSIVRYRYSARFDESGAVVG
jgi:hypothetical protein